MKGNYKNLIISIQCIIIYTIGTELPLRWAWIIIAVAFAINWILTALANRFISRAILVSDRNIPENIKTMLDKLAEEWDCGDPNCEDCTKKRNNKKENNEE